MCNTPYDLFIVTVAVIFIADMMNICIVTTDMMDLLIATKYMMGLFIFT